MGILLKAKQEGYPISLKEACTKMLTHNIRFS
ncbi:DUF3368 domain-containing protein [Gloeocapsa sp. PCC 73106]|nr:DUF3368 domain-containing protein [Gloeocapsa sp. PCC 73106]